jgi:hypothetical protein
VFTQNPDPKREAMSVNYDKYKAMSPAQLQAAIDNRTVTKEYLSWLGITGGGQQLREIAKETQHAKIRSQRPS